jgi:hypothetical protein
MMSDATWRACMDVLLALEPAAVFSDKPLHDLAVMRMANQSIEHGNTDVSPLGFSELSLVLWSRFDDRPLGLRFGALGRRLVAECGLLRFAGRVFTVVGHHVMPWNEPIGAALALMRRANAISTETGDLVFPALHHRAHPCSLARGWRAARRYPSRARSLSRRRPEVGLRVDRDVRDRAPPTRRVATRGVPRNGGRRDAVSEPDGRSPRRGLHLLDPSGSGARARG